MKNFSRIVRFAAVFSLFSLNAWAQFSGNIQGDVRDPSGAAVAGAAVTLNNAATNVNQTTNTDTAGNYRFVSLAPGDYKVSVSASGFAPAAVTVTLLTSQTVEVPVKLSVGSRLHRARLFGTSAGRTSPGAAMLPATRDRKVLRLTMALLPTV